MFIKNVLYCIFHYFREMFLLQLPILIFLACFCHVLLFFTQIPLNKIILFPSFITRCG
ncbi:hypothetical protein X975_13756, partial [Stegodyphus mimosarum]